MPQQDVTSKIIFGGGYLKRLTAQLGLNSTPSTVELEVIPGYDAEAITDNATGFDLANLEPGKTSGITIGQFKFVGIIQSWLENYSTAGLTYTVRMADPRILFDNVPVVIGPGVVNASGSNYANILNSWAFYGTPSGAGLTDNGIIFRNVRDYLSSTGTTINVLDKRFNLVFSSDFNDGTGVLNPTGIPPWYTIKANVVSLTQLLSQVGEDQGFDYYCYITPTGYTTSTGVINNIQIATIKRLNAADPSGIDNFIAGATASGTRIAYSRGKELRLDSNAAVISGPPLTLWTSYNSANGEVLPYWGRANDGSAVYSQGSILTARKAIVLLDNIYGSGVNNTLNHSAFRVSYDKYTINRTFTPNVFPPVMSVSGPTPTDVTGYYATENMMRAALYSQEAWEAMFYREDQAAAQQLGIANAEFRSPTDLENIINSKGDLQRALRLSVISPSGKGNRDPYTHALINAVYENFRTTADTYYGRQWILASNVSHSVFANNSRWEHDGYASTSNYPTLEYAPVGAAWAEIMSAPSGINNHDVLVALRSSTFKDEQNKLRAFVSIRDYTNTVGNTNMRYPVDTSIIPPDQVCIDNGKLCLPIQVEVYEKKPSRFIVSLPVSVQGTIATSGNPDQHAYKEFLFAMGYSQTQIDKYGLMKNLNDNNVYGLAPARPYIIDSAAQTYGFFIPVEFATKNFGPWANTALKPLGINLITDNDLQPATFGGYSYLESAGNQTAAKVVSTAYIVDSADLNIAGLPDYNLGENIGDNGNITSISIQYGVDGLTTAYTIRTFALPNVRNSKLLWDKIIRNQNKISYSQRELVDINKRIEKIDSGQVNTVREIKEAVGDKGRLKNSGGGKAVTQLMGFVKPADASGNYRI